MSLTRRRRWTLIASLLVACAAYVACASRAPTSAVWVRLDTELGAIDLEVDPVHAPLSATNFLRYVDAGRYDGARFHRTVTIQPDNQPDKAVKIEVVWQRWLAEHSSGQVKPPAMGSAKHPPLADAPGSYVHVP